MTKETVGCSVSCHPFGHSGDNGKFKGPHTHCRSEGTWLLGVALNMARHGHKVTIMGYYWGDSMDYPIPNNVNLQDNVEGEFDMYIDAGWDNINAPKRAERVKSLIYVHAWGGSPHTSSLIDYVEPRNIKNHFMARPSRAFWRQYKDYKYGIYMPTPLVDKIKDRGNFESKKMLWGNRGAFNRDYASDSEKVLDFMVKWKRDYHYKVLLWGDIVEKLNQNFDSEYSSKMIKKFEDLNNRELVEPYIGIGHDEFLNELDESKVLLDTAHPPEHPQNLEAVCMGAIPLIWKKAEHHFQVFENNGNNDDKKVVNVNELFNIDGPNGMDKIINDEELYQRYFDSLKKVTVDHEYDNSYEIFMKQVKEKIG